MRTINSPGVQITEKDLSLRVNSPVGTTIFVPGFASQGPMGEPIQITSASELEAIFGTPTTPAERYFYYSCREILNSPGQLLAARLPYGAEAGTTHSTKSYSGLFYPMASGLSQNELVRNGHELPEWRIGAPVHVTLSQDEYRSMLEGNFDWIDTSNGDQQVMALRDPITLRLLNFSDPHTYGSLAPYASNYDSTQPLSAQDAVALFNSAAQTTVLDNPALDELVNVRDAETNEVVSNCFEINGVGVLDSIGSAEYDPTLEVDEEGNIIEEGFAIDVTAGFVILNDIQSTVNEMAEGYYVGFADNYAVYADSPNFDSINRLQTITDLSGNLVSVPASRLDFALSATKLDSDEGVTSVSETLEKVGFVGFEGELYQDHLSFGVFRVRRSTVDPTRLTLGATERYLGSFDSNRKQVNPAGGTPLNAFLEDIINNSSPGIKLMINPQISRKFDWTFGSYGAEPIARVTVSDEAKNLYPVGIYTPDTRIVEDTKVIGNIPRKLDKMFRVIEAPENITLDVVVDAGLSTVFASTWTEELSGLVPFNDEKVVKMNPPKEGDTVGHDLPEFYIESWKSVAIPFVNFAENTRKDCMAIVDPPRHCFINGKNGKVIDQRDRNFTQDIYNNLKKISSLESNYAAMYGNWLKINDFYSGRRFWMPPSGYVGAIFARNDAVTQPWYAPAGLNRGTFDAIDIAFNPNQKQRDRLYEISVNPVAFFNGDGHVVMGQKTLQVKPTAFDRINVRRLFLTLERAVSRTVKYFVFEPNTQSTRARLVNTISPIFEYAKNNEGLYDYLIVCDDRNNTPDSIDNNELIVDIYLKPVRAAEFILINFIATRTGQDFSELI